MVAEIVANHDDHEKIGVAHPGIAPVRIVDGRMPDDPTDDTVPPVDRHAVAALERG